MKREIGLIGLTFVAISGMIGSGWLFAPLAASQYAGPASLISWGIGAVAMLLLAITFAEISAMLPVPGGIARVPQFSHGNVVAMAMGWSAWVGYNTTAPIEVEAMLHYLAPHTPWLYVGSGTSELSAWGIAICTALLLVFTLINAVGVKFFAYVNSTLTWAKIGIPILLAVIILFSIFNGDNFTSEASGGFAPYGLQGILAAVSSGGIIFAFIGFRHAIDMAGETKNPKFTIPAALMLAVGIAFVLYGLLQIAFIGAITPEQMANGWKNLSLGHQLGPMAAIASAIGILWLVSLLNVGAVTSTFAAGLVSSGSNGRLALALAQNGLFSRLFLEISNRGVPLYALFLNFVVSSLFFVLMPFQEVVALNGAAIVLSFVVGPISVVALRSLLPDRPRSFKVPLVRVTAGIAFIIATLVVYWSGWDTIWRLGIALAIGFAWFVLSRFWFGRDHGPAQLDLAEAVWLIPYLIGIGVISALGHFGDGLGIIPFGWDQLLVAILAIGTFLLAQRSKLTKEKFDRYMEEERIFERAEYGHEA
ncbi:APC family permease [Amorphus orientalis]|uniref:Amino acid transporter n=1 Tax=Amorphus orientalis TaxID=649198 RepID=A0AAE3VPQ7_9HYPH|nr:APC family permease [Amorphus orientalis]MDQ0316022.1 amino acid transporter [Amorphus orientalis]